MMNSKKILALHPDPDKQGTTIDQDKYSQIKNAILQVVQVHGEIHFKELSDAVAQVMETPFKGSIPWYVTTVKLDLEARGS